MRVLVVGGGIIGLACAWRLRAQGDEVVLLDAAPEAREASWAAGGMLAPHHELLNHGEHGDEALWRLGCRSLALWRELAAELGGADAIDHHERGGLVPALPGDPPADPARLARLAALGVAAQRLAGAALRAAEPALDPAVDGAWWLPGGQVDPRRALARLRTRCAETGVELRYGCAAAAIAGGRVALADGGALSADRVVLASGAWTPALAAATGLRLAGEPVKGQMLRFAAEPAPLSRFVHAARAYLIPRRGAGVVVGATMAHSGFDRSQDADAIARLAAGARALLPALRDAPIAETWTGLRPRLAHGRPVLARRADGLVVATGHFRNGILLAPASAVAVAALVREAACDLDLADFALPDA